jgi:hypothetical protein
MIKNFEKIKQQLQELAPVINSFKSETVQLRVVELVFRGEGEEIDLQPKDERNEGSDSKQKQKTKTKRQTRSNTKAKAKNGADETASKSGGKGGTGAHAAVSAILEEGFFKKDQSIRTIIDHLSTNKGRHFKANQISPSLLRLLRDNKLKRTKNKDNQYEYSEA